LFAVTPPSLIGDGQLGRCTGSASDCELVTAGPLVAPTAAGRFRRVAENQRAQLAHSISELPRHRRDQRAPRSLLHAPRLMPLAFAPRRIGGWRL